MQREKEGVGMKRLVLWLGIGLACCMAGTEAGAQTFRRVTTADELVEGARYVLGGCHKTQEGCVYVMAAQESTGTQVKNRKGQAVQPDAHGRIQADDGSGTAVFRLERVGTGYAFRDIALDACLAYTTKQTSAASTSLFTLTDEELEQLPQDGREKYCNTFSFVSSSSSSRLSLTNLYTKEKIYISSSSRQSFGLMVDGVGGGFKLYRQDSGDSLFIYKEVEPPVRDCTPDGDWTFGGDWTADELYALDFSEARRIDFSTIALPQAGGQAGACVLPAGYVWTYVRKGESGRLPQGWPNVIEIGKGDGAAAGEAVTPIRGSDSCRLGPKYAFSVPQGTGICWERAVGGDDGWYTIGLPFAVQGVAWDAPDGEEAVLERLSFVELSAEGAVFRRMEDGEPWEAGVPCLWRPAEARAATLCFYAPEATVQTEDSLQQQGDGFRTTYMRRDITAATAGASYLLDDSGTRFLRTEAGSWIAPCRGFLYRQGTEAAQAVRVVEREAAGVESVQAAHGLQPVYTLGGVRQGVLESGQRIPEHWPAGVYVTPRGKVLKR